jgi:hypothetical protein
MPLRHPIQFGISKPSLCCCLLEIGSSLKIAAANLLNVLLGPLIPTYNCAVLGDADRFMAWTFRKIIKRLPLSMMMI